MTAPDAFHRAAAALQGAGPDDDLCGPFLDALPVTGVTVATVGEPFGSETTCASDDVAARLDEIQFDLGEGPGWEAIRTGRPVSEPDLEHVTERRWPTASAAMREAGAGAVFSFPMRLVTLSVGVVTLYTTLAGPFDDRACRRALALAEVAARELLRRALRRAEDESRAASDLDPDRETAGTTGVWSRREVHQATGMLAAQTGADVDDALLVLRARAYADGRTVRDLAADVVARTVDLTEEPTL